MVIVAETNWSGAVTACAIAGGFIAQFLVLLWTKRQADKDATDAATKVEAVKKTLEDTGSAAKKQLDGLSQVAHDTHTLVNANMGRQLLISAKALRRIADMTRDIDDKRIATDAEALLKEHEKKQSVVDNKTKP